jgi:hypothetical protein
MGSLIDMNDKEAVYAALDGTPKVPLTQSGLGDPTIAENVDEVLESFGADADRTES